MEGGSCDDALVEGGIDPQPHFDLVTGGLPPRRPAGFVILGRARQQVKIERRSEAAGPGGLKPELPG
jgi:hypothetical protein